MVQLTLKEEWDQFLLDIDGFMEGKTSSKERNLVTGVNVATYPLPLTNICDNTVCPIEKVINNQSSLFILLRHFAWLPWRQHVKQVEAHIVCLARETCVLCVKDR